MQYRFFITVVVSAGALLAGQQAPAVQDQAQPPASLNRAEAVKPDAFVVETGSRIPLSMINSVSTRSAAEGDRVYLETVFPILSNGRIVIPPGSYVAGTVTQIKRPGRVKGRGELYVRFDSLTLPNGVTRNFSAHIGALDGLAKEKLDREEGAIKGEGNKGGDARTIGEAAAAGASAGAIAGAVTGRPARGLGMGAAGGAAAGLIGVLVSRGPDAILAKGTTVDMVLDRQLQFEEAELNFGPVSSRRDHSTSGPMPESKNQERSRAFERIL
jgi:type IV secretion system protein VirB10